MTTEMLSAARAASPTEVLAAIKTASRETGSDFNYLLATAERESNLDSSAKSRSSSAAGLFQFIDQTWLSLIKRYGGRHGLAQHADAIGRTDSGRFVVGSPEARSAILALREDPEISALMAGEAATETKQSLEDALGRAVCSGELYAAHFLGARGARRLIGLNEQNSGARADLAFPQAARANRTVFYHADGRAKTIGEVYAWAVGEPAPAPSPATVQPNVLAATVNGSRAARRVTITESTRVHGEDAQGAEPGITHRGPRFVFVSAAEMSPAETGSIPRSPLALSAGLLDIFAAAFAAPYLARRQG